MKSIRLALLLFTTLVGALVASAQQTLTTAYVSSVDGNATYLAPGSKEATAVEIGQSLPAGSVITTDATSTVIIVSHEGIQTSICPKTTAAIGEHSVSADGVRTAVIDLKLGMTVSVLDPTRRASNNYAVRTPRGVAAARGTKYTVTVRLASGADALVTVNTLEGKVSFSINSGKDTPQRNIEVSEGHSADSSSTDSTTIADALANPSSAEAQADILEALDAAAVALSELAATSAGSADSADVNKALNLFVENVTKIANEVAEKGGDTNRDLAKALVSKTVITVRERAGDSSSDAVTTITTTAKNNEVKAAADQAKSAPVTVKPVTVSVTPSTQASPQPINAPAQAPITTPATTTDITIITVISASAPRQ
jgi:hypothetical protein